MHEAHIQEPTSLDEVKLQQKVDMYKTWTVGTNSWDVLDLSWKMEMMEDSTKKVIKNSTYVWADLTVGRDDKVEVK